MTCLRHSEVKQEASMSEFKPLQGIQVLDFSHVIAGPMATFYLQQFGADVMKVESRSGGDVMRRGNAKASFAALNAGKTTVEMDLRDPADLHKLQEMASSADVVLDSLRPGVLDRFDLGAETLRAANPSLIYCAISGFGRRGPWATRPAYDHVVQAATGMTMLAGKDGDDPIKTGFPVVDAATGILAALAVVAALRERDRTGLGRFIDVSMAAAAMQLMYPLSCLALTDGEVPPRVGNQGYSHSPAANIFQTKDGWIAIGANTPRQFLALLRLLELEHLASDPSIFDKPLSADAPAEFLRAKNPDLLHQQLAAALAGVHASVIEARCAQVNVAAARVRTLPEFAKEAVANDILDSKLMCDGDLSVTSPGWGFRVS
jgi:crotonobetainyl-CoA:carnitine CoA-transferase CaiB-like acyl-CoA transferase